MKKFIIQFILLVIVIGVGMFYYMGGASTLPIPFLPQASKTQQVKINDTVISIAIADTQEKRSKGLGGRENLASDSGMLFVFDRADRYSFWMKGLKFPLDFVWIRDMEVVDISENVQPPAEGTPDSSLQIYSANTGVDKVLEVAGGFVKAHGIKVGDKIKLK